jgi:hypothetical protein
MTGSLAGALPALVTAGVGVLLLVVLLLFVARRVRRLELARTALRADVAERVAALKAMTPVAADALPRPRRLPRDRSTAEGR